MSLFPTLQVEKGPLASQSTRKLVVFSGGSAANSLVDVFNEVMEKNSCSLAYVMPISDNGGSSSELIRVFGGPGIGDIRSKFMTLPISCIPVPLVVYSQTKHITWGCVA